MPRPPRISFPGALFHVMARGNNGQPTFLEDIDRDDFLETLADIKARNPFRLYAYCLMSNHFHLLIQIDNTPLSTIMQRVLTRYSKNFNLRSRRIGHLFQSRYKAILCQKDTYLLALLRYIHLNPVRAAMVKEASDWPWSSHREYLGQRDNPLVDFNVPLALFSQALGQARNIYTQFITSGPAPIPEDFSTTSSLPCLGDEAFINEIKNRFYKALPVDMGISPMSLLDIGGMISAETGIPLEALKNKNNLPKIVYARNLLVLRARDNGIKPSDIADFLHRSRSSISKTFSRQGL